MAERVTISIPYGISTQSATIPLSNYAGMATAPEAIVAAGDETAEIRRALANPIGSPTIRELVKPGFKISIIISDYTRPTPSGLILRPVLDELHATGVPKENITIVIACGLHTPSSDKQLETMVGLEIMGRYKIINHQADDSENMVFVGSTSTGIPVKVNRLITEADFCISIAGIDPHHLAGWSGGAKNLLPGVSSRETVNAHHILSQNPEIRVGRSDGNPFREQLEEAARLAKVNFIVNVILSQDKKVAYAVAGDIVKAHRAGIAFSEEKLLVCIEKVDAVIGSPGGAPRDGELWQTEGKCLTRVSSVVRPGGFIILVAQCPSGIGQEEFKRYLTTMNCEQLDAALKIGPFSMALAKALNFVKQSELNHLYLVTEGIDNAMLPGINVRILPDLQAAIEDVLIKNPGARFMVVPNAAGLVLKVKEAQLPAASQLPKRK